MVSKARADNRGRYRVLGPMMLVIAALSLVQILSGGIWRLFALQTTTPMRWNISYEDTNGRKVVSQIAAPAGDSFNEGVTASPVLVEMELSRCASFSSYRFWVGPYGPESAARLPGEWMLFVRGDEGDWVLADSERMKAPYRNDTWYTFPLRGHKGCIQHVRWDITKPWNGNIFRLFRFQLY